MPQRIVVGITGASGAIYARRVLELLAHAGCEIHLTVSAWGKLAISAARSRCSRASARRPRTVYHAS